MTPAPPRARVAVVGAGISGLAAAWRLHQVGDPVRGPVDLVVLEQDPVVGGKLQLAEVAGHLVDVGSEAMLALRPEAVDLIVETGLGHDLVHPQTTAANVVRDGALYPLPPGTVMGVPRDPSALRGLLTDDEVARVAAEPGLPAPPLNDDVDVASWVSARVGRAVVDRLVEPLLGGVYAGHASRLSLQATVPALWAVAARGGSLLEALRSAGQPPAGRQPAGRPRGGVPKVFAGLSGGVGRLPLHVADRLRQAGVEVRTGTGVQELVRLARGGWRLTLGQAGAGEVLDVDAVILALPPAPAARLLAGPRPEVAGLLGAIDTASMAVVSLAVPRTAVAGLPGSGVLVPPIEGRPVKAATFSSAKWGWVGDLDPELAFVRASLGRRGEEAVLQRADDEVAALATADLSELLGRPLPAVAVHVTRWDGGLPQYDVGHVGRVARVRAGVAELPGLAVCGAAYDGVGIAACVASATRAAHEVASYLTALPAATTAGEQ